MAELSGFPYFEIQFDKEGAIHKQQEVDAALAFLAGGTTTDVFVISHGWNNDMQEARKLYKDFFARVREVMRAGAVPLGANRTFAIIGILWPSKKFADTELKPSGAAGIQSVVPTAVVKKELERLRKGVFDNPKSAQIIAKAKAEVDKLEDSPAARQRFVELLRSLPAKRRADAEDGSDHFFKLKPDEIMNRLRKPLLGAPRPKQAPGGGATSMAALRGGAGGAASFGKFFGGFVSAARNLLNYTTYYQMKERAGVVGSGGVNKVLRKVRTRLPQIRLHLIGHSFGGRLVTATALGPSGKNPIRFDSLTLLQAAFSHNGFARRFHDGKDGFFRKVVSEGRITGPVLITCTSNDKAVGIAYPVASLLAGDDASALGDRNDRFGGIGRNGAHVDFTREASDGVLGAVGTSYSFQAGRLYNLNADSVIGDHSDICKKEVAYALLTAIK